MPALGHKRTFAVQKGMSALPPKADIKCDMWDLFGPKAGVSGQLRAFREQRSCARQSHPDFGELARLSVHLDGAAMLLHNDVVTNGEPKSSSFSGRFGCEERVEHLFFYFRWDTGAVIPNPDFHTIAKAAGRGRKGWLIA